MQVANLHASETNREKYPIIVVYYGPGYRVWAKTLENFKQTMIEKEDA
jgi:hypothetical protein